MKENKTAYRISDLDESERPRERLERLGAQALNHSELIANDVTRKVWVKGKVAELDGIREKSN